MVIVYAVVGEGGGGAKGGEGANERNKVKEVGWARQLKEAEVVNVVGEFTRVHYYCIL